MKDPKLERIWGCYQNRKRCTSEQAHVGCVGAAANKEMAEPHSPEDQTKTSLPNQYEMKPATIQLP